MSQLRLGYLYGLGAYTLWGFFPAYFKLLRPAGPIEVLAHRIVWSVLFMVLVLTAIRRWRKIRRAAAPAAPRVGGIALAAVLIGVNWGTYIYGVNSRPGGRDLAGLLHQPARRHRARRAGARRAPAARAVGRGRRRARSPCWC